MLEHLTFNKDSADGRLIVFDYGMMEVMKHPVFGIGLNDWTRPWYRAGKSSFDNFWLLEAMRYGFRPSRFLVARLGRQRAAHRHAAHALPGGAGLPPRLPDHPRRPHLTLGTVYIWNATSVFVWIYIGAGAWFYMRGRRRARCATKRRSGRGGRAQARPGGPSHPRTPPGGGATALAPGRARRQSPAAIRRTARAGPAWEGIPA